MTLSYGEHSCLKLFAFYPLSLSLFLFNEKTFSSPKNANLKWLGDNSQSKKWSYSTWSQIIHENLWKGTGENEVTESTPGISILARVQNEIFFPHRKKSSEQNEISSRWSLPLHWPSAIGCFPSRLKNIYFTFVVMCLKPCCQNSRTEFIKITWKLTDGEQCLQECHSYQHW